MHSNIPIRGLRQPATAPVWALHYGSAQTPMVTAVPDVMWPRMFRLRWPDGSTSDNANLTRCKDAALALCAPGRNPQCFRWHLSDKPTEGRTCAGPARAHQDTARHEMEGAR